MSTDVTPAGPVPDPPASLVAEWAAYGIVAAAARFIPVPLLDDAVRGRATRFAVVRTLRTHGRRYPAGTVEVLYKGVDGAGGSALRYLRSVPRRVLLFPVRKYVAIFGSVRGVPTDVMTVLLLARALHRHLARGGLADGQPEPARAAEAQALRRAFDATLADLDLRILAGAVAEALSQGRELTGAAVRQARALRRQDDEAAAGELTAGNSPDAREVDAAAGRVAGLLHRHDVAAVLARFDQQLDARLATGASSRGSGRRGSGS